MSANEKIPYMIVDERNKIRTRIYEKNRAAEVCSFWNLLEGYNRYKVIDKKRV